MSCRSAKGGCSEVTSVLLISSRTVRRSYYVTTLVRSKMTREVSYLNHAVDIEYEG
jgi:hypothetical protein